VRLVRSAPSVFFASTFRPRIPSYNSMLDLNPHKAGIKSTLTQRALEMSARWFLGQVTWIRCAESRFGYLTSGPICLAECSYDQERTERQLNEVLLV